MVYVGLCPAGAGGGVGGVLVAVGEAGDADDGPGVQFAAADRGGDQRVTEWDRFGGGSGVRSSQPRQDQETGLFSTSFPARMQEAQGWRMVIPRIQVPGSAVVVSLMRLAPVRRCRGGRRVGR